MAGQPSPCVFRHSERRPPGAVSHRRPPQHAGRHRDRAARLSADGRTALSRSLHRSREVDPGPDRQASPVDQRRSRSNRDTEQALAGDQQQARRAPGHHRPVRCRAARRGPLAGQGQSRQGSDGSGTAVFRGNAGARREQPDRRRARGAAKHRTAAMGHRRRRAGHSIGGRRLGLDRAALHPAVDRRAARGRRPECRPGGARARAHRRPRPRQRGNPALRLYRHPRPARAAGQHHGLHQRAGGQPRCDPVLREAIGRRERGRGRARRPAKRRWKTCRRRSASSAPPPARWTA